MRATPMTAPRVKTMRAFRREEQTNEQCDQKDDHRRFVLDAQAAGEAEDDPPAR